MLLFSSTDWVDLRTQAWVKHARKFVRASSSISSEAIGTNGSIEESSSRSALASAGMSSADSGGITSFPLSPATEPTSFGGTVRQGLLQVREGQAGSSFTWAMASAAPGGWRTSWQNSARRAATAPG